jgi:hypothetical protein
MQADAPSVKFAADRPRVPENARKAVVYPRAER